MFIYRGPFLHDFLVMVNILLLWANLCILIEFYCVLVQDIYFILYFEDISLQISSFAI